MPMSEILFYECNNLITDEMHKKIDLINDLIDVFKDVYKAAANRINATLEECSDPISLQMSASGYLKGLSDSISMLVLKKIYIIKGLE